MSDATPKITIVCYSKTGHSWNVAERLALVLDAQLFALQTQRYSFPYFGYIRAGIDSLRGAPTPLEHPLPDIKNDDAVIICGPVWTSYPAVPVISYLQQEPRLPRVVGLMLTCGDHSPPEKAYTMAEQEFGRPFVTKGAISNNIEDQPEADARIKEFASAIQDALAVK